MDLQGRNNILNLLNIRPFPSNSAPERALVLSQSESSDIGCRYPDLRESIEFPGNSSGKSDALACESTSVSSVLCDIMTRVNAKAQRSM